MRVSIGYGIVCILSLVFLVGCQPSEEQKRAAAQQAAQAAQEAERQAAIARMHELGQRMRNVQKEMADKSAREPARSLEITAEFMPRLTAIDAEVTQLPQAQRDEFARTYRKN